MKYGTKGIMGVDYEKRIDFDRLRKDRVQKIKAQMEGTEIGCLILFDNHNKRYATATCAMGPEPDNMGRYSIIPKGGEPYIFGFGSEVAATKLNCPWIADRAYPAHSTMFGALPKEWGLYENFIKDLEMVLSENNIKKDAPIGIDIMDGQLLTVLLEKGYNIVDGQPLMLKARMIKTEDEIKIMADAASGVDAAFHKIAKALEPGIRENDIQAVASHELHRQGSQWVLNVQVTSGPRTHPHPHLSSDRMIRPQELVFIDIQSLYNGYQTCYYRTLCCGAASKLQKKLYADTYEMLEKGIDKIKPGNTTADVVNVWPTADYFGFKTESEAFGLAYAHGLGVSLWEMPIISRAVSLDHPMELKPGMVIAVETYAGKGMDGARIESEVVVTEDGNEIITRFPADHLIECNAEY